MIQVRREPIDAVGRQPQRLADVAHRRARTIADDLRGDAGTVAAVFLVDVLQHFLAPFVLEIDVDVRRLVALPADETLEEQIGAIGIDRGDAQAIADRGVGRRAASLAEDAACAGEDRPGPRRSGSTPRSAAPRSAPARARAAWRPSRARRPDSECGRRPRSAGSGAAPASGRAGTAPRDTGNAARRAKTCSARPAPRCGRGRRARRRRAEPSRPATSDGVRRSESVGAPSWATVVRVANRGEDILQRPAGGIVVMHIVGR